MTVLVTLHIYFTPVSSSEETEYWCGGCTIPLAMLLPDEDVHRHSLRKDDVALTPSKHVNKIITLPVEPKVNSM